MIREPDLATLRKFLIDHYDDAELTRLCFDHFHEVFQDFTADATKGQKALQLIGFCQRRGLLPDLMSVIEEERPVPFMERFGSLDEALFADDVRVDLNTANQTKLAAVPGVGHRLAKTIIRHRPYESVEELRRVPGIGPKRYQAIRDWYTVTAGEDEDDAGDSAPSDLPIPPPQTPSFDQNEEI